MAWLNYILDSRLFLVFLSLIYAIWALLRLANSSQKRRRTSGFGIAVAAVACGVASAAAFLAFYSYWWLTHDFFAHGSVLWLYFIASLLIACVGLVLGFFAISSTRLAAVLLSFVMIFQWLTELATGARERQVLTILMLLVLMAMGAISFAKRYVLRTQ